MMAIIARRPFASSAASFVLRASGSSQSLQKKFHVAVCKCTRKGLPYHDFGLMQIHPKASWGLSENVRGRLEPCGI